MPRSARLVAPDDRAKLRDAIRRRQDEEQRLAALEDARSRAHAGGWHAASKLQDSEETLRRVTRDEPQRRAYAYLNSEPDADPVAEAKTAVDAARREVEQLEGAEVALTGEIARSQSRLRDLRADQSVALTEILADSAEYAALAAQHKLAWIRLRSVRAALEAVASSCSGPDWKRFADEARKSEPLEADRHGYPTDPEVVNPWVSALAALENDADAALPRG
jgi:hypothetical protein